MGWSVAGDLTHRLLRKIVPATYATLRRGENLSEVIVITDRKV